MDVWQVLIIIAGTIIGTVLGFFNGRKKVQQNAENDFIERAIYDRLKDKYQNKEVENDR